MLDIRRQPVVKKVFRSLPSQIQRLLRQAHFIFWQASQSLPRALSRSRETDDPNTIYSVSPHSIRYVSVVKFHPLLDRGRVVGGDWDRLSDEFEGYDFYQSFKRRAEEGASWEILPVYQRVLRQIESGEGQWGCMSKLYLDRKCQEWDAIYEGIRAGGYVGGAGDPAGGDDYIQVNIGREGDLLLNEGGHRLAFAKLLKLNKVPVRIGVRHPGWVNFKQGLRDWARTQSGGKIYAPAPHPDLREIPSFYSDLRWNLIRMNLRLRAGTVLDIGSLFGYFCHKFEEIGFECMAVEPDPRHAYFLKRLRRACNKTFSVVEQPLEIYARQLGRLRFDVVLALNIFHHFLKTRSSYEQLLQILGRLEARELYFQGHLSGEPQMTQAYAPLSGEELVKLIAQRASLDRVVFLGTAEDGRPVYQLTPSTAKSLPVEPANSAPSRSGGTKLDLPTQLPPRE